MKSLTDSFKDKLYTNLLNSIDQEFIAKFLTLPPNDPVLIEKWGTRVVRAINNKVITWQQFFALLQPDFAEKLKAAIIKKAQEKKDNAILAFLKSMEH